MRKTVSTELKSPSSLSGLCGVGLVTCCIQEVK